MRLLVDRPTTTTRAEKRQTDCRHCSPSLLREGAAFRALRFHQRREASHPYPHAHCTHAMHLLKTPKIFSFKKTQQQPDLAPQRSSAARRPFAPPVCPRRTGPPRCRGHGQGQGRQARPADDVPGARELLDKREKEEEKEKQEEGIDATFSLIFSFIFFR